MLLTKCTEYSAFCFQTDFCLSNINVKGINTLRKQWNGLLGVPQSMLVAWLCGHSKTVSIALCIVFYFVQASTVTTSLQQLLTLLSVRLKVCFMFHISVPIFHYSCHITEAEGEVGIPLKRFKPPSIFILTISRRYFCCGSLLLLVLTVRIYTLVQLLCSWHIL